MLKIRLDPISAPPPESRLIQLFLLGVAAIAGAAIGGAVGRGSHSGLFVVIGAAVLCAIMAYLSNLERWYRSAKEYAEKRAASAASEEFLVYRVLSAPAHRQIELASEDGHMYSVMVPDGDIRDFERELGWASVSWDHFKPRVSRWHRRIWLIANGSASLTLPRGYGRDYDPPARNRQHT